MAGSFVVWRRHFIAEALHLLSGRSWGSRETHPETLGGRRSLRYRLLGIAMDNTCQARCYRSVCQDWETLYLGTREETHLLADHLRQHEKLMDRINRERSQKGRASHFKAAFLVVGHRSLVLMQERQSRMDAGTELFWYLDGRLFLFLIFAHISCSSSWRLTLQFLLICLHVFRLNHRMALNSRAEGFATSPTRTGFCCVLIDILTYRDVVRWRGLRLLLLLLCL